MRGWHREGGGDSILKHGSATTVQTEATKLHPLFMQEASRKEKNSPRLPVLLRFTSVFASGSLFLLQSLFLFTGEVCWIKPASHNSPTWLCSTEVCNIFFCTHFSRFCNHHDHSRWLNHCNLLGHRHSAWLSFCTDRSGTCWMFLLV